MKCIGCGKRVKRTMFMGVKVRPMIHHYCRHIFPVWADDWEPATNRLPSWADRDSPAHGGKEEESDD